MYEVHWGGRITQEAVHARRDLNIEGLKIIDLHTTRSNGDYWDLSQKSHQDEVLRLLKTDDPDLVIAGPPCTDLCALNVGLNYPKMPAEEV